MSAAAKIAISMPAATLRALERARLELKRSRSAVVAEAVEGWLRARSSDGADERYAEAYLRTPERVDERAAIAAGATAGWEGWE